MRVLQDKSVSFGFERQFCLKNLKVWQNEARNLFYSAEVLFEFEAIKSGHIFDRDERFSSMFPNDLTDRGFFNHRVQRMLWAYGIENLLKLIILANYKIDNPDAMEVPFGEIKSHDLHALAQRAKVELSEPEAFYCGVLEKCSVWAGRYPLPVNEQQMYEQREPLPSREALFERSKNMYEKYLRGENPRVISESDVLHSGIGREEHDIYRSLKDRFLAHSDNLLSNVQGS
jgi:hypothetical protein